MFENLIESKPKKTRTLKQSASSLILHVVLGTAPSGDRGGRRDDEGDSAGYDEVHPDQPPPPPPPPETPPPEAIVTANPPPLGFQTVMPPTEIPKEIPRSI